MIRCQTTEVLFLGDFPGFEMRKLSFIMGHREGKDAALCADNKHTFRLPFCLLFGFLSLFLKEGRNATGDPCAKTKDPEHLAISSDSS